MTRPREPIWKTARKTIIKHCTINLQSRENHSNERKSRLWSIEDHLVKHYWGRQLQQETYREWEASTTCRSGWQELNFTTSRACSSAKVIELKEIFKATLIPLKTHLKQHLEAAFNAHVCRSKFLNIKQNMRHFTMATASHKAALKF